MDSQKVDMFIMSNNRYFDNTQLMLVKKQLLELDESKSSMVEFLQFKDPTTSLIVSIIVGQLGIDRFLIGDVGLGVAKLLTCGGFGLWTIVDWFLIQNATKEKNMQKLREVIFM